MYPKREAQKAKLGLRLATYRISGENVTLDEIAGRLGITKVQVSTRLQREKQLPGCITWERLAK